MSNPANTRVLVTGGTGFIGRYVVDRLLADGFSPLVTAFNSAKRRYGSPFASVDIIDVDLTDAAQIDNLVQYHRPEIVLHLAGVTGTTDPTGKINSQVNFKGTASLLNALERSGVDRVVLLGTAAEYGSQAIPFRETMPSKPVSDYAISKAEANQFALQLHSTTGFPVTILRIFTAYGHGQPHKMFLSQLITHALLNRHFKMTDGIQKRDFVFIHDVVRAISAAMIAENAVGQVINIGSGKGTALREVAESVWAICEADKSQLNIGSLKKSGDDIFDTEADISLAEKVLGWKPGPDILSEGDNYSRLTDMIQKMKTDLTFSIPDESRR